MLLEGTRPLGGEERVMIAALGADGLRGISGSPARAALPRAAHFLARLVKAPGFLRREMRPLLAEVEAGEDRYVARRYGKEGPCSLRISVRPAGSRTRVHDRSSWGPIDASSVSCSIGALRAPRRRLRAGLVRLEEIWRPSWAGATTGTVFDLTSSTVIG